MVKVLIIEMRRVTFTSIVSHRSSLGESGLAIFFQLNKRFTVIVDVGIYGRTEGPVCFLDPLKKKQDINLSSKQKMPTNQEGD